MLEYNNIIILPAKLYDLYVNYLYYIVGDRVISFREKNVLLSAFSF